MKIDTVDLFYFSMPEVLDISDGSQDALLVRIRAGGYEGWGECEASPVPSIASWCCPRSHVACKPVRDSVLGQTVNDASDIIRIGNLVRENSLDLLQADHTLSGIDIALWDLLGRKLETPAWRLLGYNQSYPKTPYASQLFGDTPQETYDKAVQSRSRGYQAAKFGWGPFGKGTVAQDRDQLHAAREGLGADGILLVDVGTAWGHDFEAAAARVPDVIECNVHWLEEPFNTGALSEYSALAKRCRPTPLAGGEGSHNADGALLMMEHGDVGYIQIDTGRIGGLAPAKLVADAAVAKGIAYVNHTFTSHMALSASLQPFAGLESHVISEYPVELTPLAWEMTTTHIDRDANGQVKAPDAPGLGITADTEAVRKYLVQVEIRVGGNVLYETPEL